MSGLLIALIVLIALDLAALRWGADSREGETSAEWERRRNWLRSDTGKSARKMAYNHDVQFPAPSSLQIAGEVLYRLEHV